MKIGLKKLLLFFLLILCGSLKSQNIEDNIYIKEKLTTISSTTNDSLKSVLYNDISEKAGLLKYSNVQNRYADSAIYFSQKTNNSSLYIRSITSKINAAIVKQDTTTVYRLFREGLRFSNDKNIEKNDRYFLKFKIREIYYFALLCIICKIMSGYLN